MRRNIKIALVLFVALMMLITYQLGLFEHFAEPVKLKEALVGLGEWGYLAFVVSYTFLQPFGVPGTIFIWSAPLIWPWPVAFVLSLIGTQAASVVGFSFSRFIGRDWVVSKIPERFKKYDEALAKRAFVTVVLLRFVFWMPQPLHAFFGVSKVSFSTHFWGSLLGYLVPIFLVSFFGPKLFSLLFLVPVWVWVFVAMSLLVILVWVWRKQKLSLKAKLQ
jgi:uncharacterized membrane protein YdjX (TVP38/TMEM64 family)